MFYDPNLPQSSLKKQVVDQTAHMAVGFAILAILLYFDHALAAFVSGCAIGFVREISEKGKVLSLHSLLDVAFWGVGGAIAYLALA